MPLQLFLDKVLRACRVDFRSALQEDVFQLFGTNVADACLSGSAPHRTHWYVWDAYRYTRFFFFLCVGTMEASMSMVRREVEKPILCRAPLCETYQFGMASLICSLYKRWEYSAENMFFFFASIWRTLCNQCTTTKKGSGKRTLPTCCSMYSCSCSVLWISVDVDRLVLWTQGAWCAGYWISFLLKLVDFSADGTESKLALASTDLRYIQNMFWVDESDLFILLQNSRMTALHFHQYKTHEGLI